MLLLVAVAAVVAGTVDISPSTRFCITEAEIITSLYRGVEKLKAAEDDS